MTYKVLKISDKDKRALQDKFIQTSETVPIASDPKFFSLIVALGIHQEIGTIHDEFSVFLFDQKTGQKIPREKLRSEMIEYQGFSGLRIWAEGFDALDPRVRG